MSVLTLDEIKVRFIEKLQTSGSFDEAFMKAVWSAFRHGYNEGLTNGRDGVGELFEGDNIQ